jgi:hypothetical protein
MSAKPPARCVACGGAEFTAPKDIHGYVPATFGWFGDPLVGFACSACGFVHLFRKPRRKVSAKLVRDRGRDGGESGDGADDEATREEES